MIMAKKVRFPLQMNGADVRTMEELREHFDLESVLGYFANGKLATWLQNRYYDNEAAAVEALLADDEKLARKLCSILNVPYEEENTDIDIVFIKRRQEKIAILSQTTNDESLISKVDAIALDQEDLLDILDTGTEKMIYLFKGEFDIPLTVTDITYVGLENPVVTLRAYDNVDFNSLNLKFVDINYTWNNSNLTSSDELYQAESLYESGKVDEAKKILDKLSTDNNPRLMNLKSWKYFNNLKELDEKLKKAEELFSVWECEKLLPIVEELASYGSAKAKYILGILYIVGFNKSLLKGKKNYRKGRSLIEESIKAGYLPALAYEANIGYATWNMVETSADNLIRVKELADAGDSLAALAYFAFHRTIKDKEKRLNEIKLEYLKKSPSFAYYIIMGKMYYFSEYLNSNDVSTALQYFKQSAEYGFSPAEVHITDILIQSSILGRSSSEYFYWLERAYNHGNDLASYRLTECYLKGYGNTEKNYYKAFELTKERAAEIGYSSCICDLAEYYEKGIGTQVNIAMAKKYYRMAADMGDDWAEKQCKRLGC